MEKILQNNEKLFFKHFLCEKRVWNSITWIIDARFELVGKTQNNFDRISRFGFKYAITGFEFILFQKYYFIIIEKIFRKQI